MRVYCPKNRLGNVIGAILSTQAFLLLGIEEYENECLLVFEFVK